MMREMSYRDKMILLIITVLIILAVGFFALVRPKYNTMVEDRGIYEDTKTEWDGIEAKKAQIPTLKENITDIYKEASAVAELFVNEAFEPVNDTLDNLKANYYLDRYVQPLIDESELKVSSLAMTGITSETLEYYYYEPDVLTYSLLESADINGEYAQQATALLLESEYLAEKETIDVMTNTVTLAVTGTREQLMTFLEKIRDEENAVRITNVNIADYTFGEGKTQTITEEQTDAEGNVTTVTREVPVAANGQGESTITLNLTFYNAMPVDEPVLGD